MSQKAPKSRRASYITRAFGHFMDIGGAHAGTWIIGVLELSHCPTDEHLKELVQTRLLKYSRFTSVLKVNSHGAKYELQPFEKFDWDYHLTKIFENERPTSDQVESFVGKIVDFNLDIKKPLWRLLVVPELATGKASLIFCLSHAIADGISAVGVLFGIMDDCPFDPALPMKNQSQVSKRRNGDDMEQKKILVNKRSGGPKVGFFSKIGQFFSGTFDGMVSAIGSADPKNTLKIQTDTFSKEYTGRKLMKTTESISLQEIKDIKNKFAGATVNDVLLAILTMTVKTFLQEVNDPILKKKNKIRGNFPVSLRGNDEAILKDNNPSNKWGPCSFRFPLNYQDPIDCVWKVKRIIDLEKVSPKVYVQDFLAKSFLGTLPRKAVMPMLLKINANVSLMLSNVPGPQEKVHLGGYAVDHISFFVVAPMGSYLGLFSYDNKVSLSINFDETLKEDPELLAKHWLESFEILKHEVAKFPEMIPKSKSKRTKIEKSLQDKATGGTVVVDQML